jgi:hypothetical protein
MVVVARRRRFVVAALLLLIAACGGEAREGGGEGPPSREEWISSAEAICAQADEEVRDLGTPQTLDELAVAARETTAIVRGELRELRELGSPPGDEAAVEGIVDALDRVGGAMARVADAAAAGDEAAVQEAGAEFEALNDRAGELARDYGLSECLGDEG